jgi:hypothetical protein
METEPTTERGWWDLLAPQTPESMRWKSQFDRDQATIQEYLRNNHGIKNCVGYCGQEVQKGAIPIEFFGGLQEIHPRALLLLAEHGVEFKPFLWERMDLEEPRPRCCFGNSFFRQYVFNRIAREQKDTLRMSYVEGVALGARSNPVLHAWNALGDTAIDWTWYAVTGWSTYLGLPLTERQYQKARRLAYPDGSFHLLLKTDVYPLVEEYLTKIMKRRPKKQTPTTTPPQ